VLGPDPNGAAGLDPDRLHVLGMHVQGAHDGLIRRVILADVDLLPLLGRAARVHDEAFGFHRMLLLAPHQPRGQCSTARVRSVKAAATTRSPTTKARMSRPSWGRASCT